MCGNWQRGSSSRVLRLCEIAVLKGTERVGAATGSGAPTQNKTRTVAYILNLYVLVFLPDSVGKSSHHQAEGHTSRELSLLRGKKMVCKVHRERNC